MKRNKFNESHYKLFSADMGNLYPISCFEVLPGDTLQMSSSVFLRFAPMLSAVMHPIKVGIYSFYVPLRLLWDNFENFITGGEDGLDTTVPPTFTMKQGNYRGSLPDYLGVPVGYDGPFSSLPIRGYYKIFNEYFRDQDLFDSITIGDQKGDGNIDIETNTDQLLVMPSAWEKDYFTTCRPWPQKGPTVTVPVNGINSGDYAVNAVRYSTKFYNDAYVDVSSNEVPQQYSQVSMTSDFGLKVNNPSLTTPANPPVNGSIRAVQGGQIGVVSIPANTGANIRLDDLREAFALQRFEEHRAAYGSRYTEYLRYLGVRSSDARLQRPEYLGGGKTTMQISEVLQTAADGDNPVGTLRGHGIGAVSSRTFRRYFEEHGLVMTLLKVQPIAIYEQGLSKMWSRQTKEDYWQKELEHIGQQEVMTRELYAAADSDTVFGYQNRYDDYRAIPSTVAGEMRDLLDFWHMARNFGNEPVLNRSFVYGSPTKRIFAEQTQNEIYGLASHKCVIRRFMSKQGNPIM